MDLNGIYGQIVSFCGKMIDYVQANTDAVFFMILVTIALISALYVVESDEVMHSAFYLALVFVCVGVAYFFLEAEFVGVIQIIVYVGAITMLYAFSIMLTRRTIMKGEE